MNQGQNQIDVQALISKLQGQLGAQLVQISVLELRIEQLQKSIPQPVENKETDNG